MTMSDPVPFAPPLPAIGFIGLGVMGLPMAQNLIAAGYSLTVFSRSMDRATRLLELGASAASTSSEVARRSDIVITMLPDSPEVSEVLLADEGLLVSARSGLTWIDMSSIAPTVAQDLARRARLAGVVPLDAPVSGGEKGAIEATLSIMVGGAAEDFDRCLPVLHCLGSSVVHVGATGAGQIAKVCNQIVVGCTIAAIAEALVLATKAGVEPAKVREALLGGFAGSKILEIHGQRMLDGLFEPGFRQVLHRKDLANALEAARAYGSTLALSSVVAELMNAQIAAGEGDLDHSALVKVYELLAHQEIR